MMMPRSTKTVVIYEGMDRYEAREAIVKELDKEGLLVRIEDYSHNVGTHDRCKTTVEPMIKKQWFVKMDELIKPAVKAVKEGEIKLIPERMEKTYFNWTDNIRDWCISRQLWWGHRIPAYYCDDCGETVVAKEMPKICPKCGGSHFHTGSGHTGYLVLIRTLAVLYTGLAGADRRSEIFLSDRCTGNRI